jgi:predicted patatin/cPLA2 family phospholipase
LNNNKIISANLSELKTIFEQLKKDKENYDSIRQTIETKIKDIQDKAIKFKESVEYIKSSVINIAYRLTKIDKNIIPKVDKNYLKNSMLLIYLVQNFI